MGIWQSAGYLTNSPSITPGDTSSSVIRTGTWATWYFYRQPMEHLKPYLQIESPVFEAGTDLTTIVLESLKEGTLPLRSNEVGPNEGFNVNLLIPHYENKTKPSNPYIFTAFLASMQAGKGNQENSYFEVTELEVLQSGPRLFFTVTFEFSCELYYQGNPSKHYKRLDNGVFRIGFELKK